MVGQRERGLKVERGRQVDVSAHVGRELQRLYVQGYPHHLQEVHFVCGRPERKESGTGEWGDR